MHFAPKYETGSRSQPYPNGYCLKDEEIKVGIDCKVNSPTTLASFNVGSNYETVNNTWPNAVGAGVNDVIGSLWGQYDTTKQDDFWVNYSDVSDYINGAYKGEPLAIHLHITDGVFLDKTFDAPIIITFHPNTTPAKGLSAYHLGTYKLTQSETWTPDNNPVSMMYGTAHTIIKIRDSLVIPAGLQLTLQHVKLEFGPDGSTLVQTEPGSGKSGGYFLIDSSSTLTALKYCYPDDTLTWQGVYVWGDATRNQSRFNPGNTGPSWQGVLEMRNNSEISYADWAVHNDGPIASTGAAAGRSNNRNGGIVDVYDSRFVNNIRGVNFERYPIPGIPIAGTKPLTYNSWFRNTDFEVTVPLSKPFIAGISGRGVNGVGIMGCRFSNTATQANSYKSGLYGIDFGPSVSDFIPYAGATPIHSEFHNLDAGMLLQNTGILPTTTVVSNSIFEDNYNGVNLNGLPAPQLHGNTFSIPQGHSDPDEALGVFILPVAAIV